MPNKRSVTLSWLIGATIMASSAIGIAQMMRVALYRPMHVKTLRSQKLRMLLTHRKLLQSKAIAIENDLRGTLRHPRRDHARTGSAGAPVTTSPGRQK